MSDTTEQLVTRASAGDAVAIDALLERHLPELHAYVRLRCGEGLRRKESCSDLVQSVCREVLNDVGELEYRGAAAFRSWLFTTAMRKIVDRDRYWKKARRDVAREAAAPASRADGFRPDLLAAYARLTASPSAAVMTFEEIDRLERAFDALSEDQREVVTSICLVGESYADLARRLGRLESWCRNQFSRALARISLASE